MQENKTLVVKPFSEPRMAVINSEFKTREYVSGTTKRQVFSESNLIYVANFRQQHVTVETEYDSYSYFDSGTWVGQHVEAYLFFELSNFDEKISVSKIKEQFFYRLVKKKIHVGIKPWVRYNVTLAKNTPPTSNPKISFLKSIFSSLFASKKPPQNTDHLFDCIIKVVYEPEEFCPEFHYFKVWLNLFVRIIEDSVMNPNLEITSEEVEHFLNDGEDKGFYTDRYFVEYDYDDDYDDDNYENYYREEDESLKRLESFRRFAKIVY